MFISSYLGIIQDPTVNGVGDSENVLTREEPLPNRKH
ncbi:phage holin [Bacillus sp. MUM 116]